MGQAATVEVARGETKTRERWEEMEHVGSGVD